MAHTISIINNKGGVAKTTTVVNLGTALWLLGYKVLLVDTDDQCNLTTTIDESCMASDVPNLYNWMLDPAMEPPIYERYPGFDLVPSSMSINNLNTELANKMAREKYLKKCLDRVADNYDYILIDCAPNKDSLININVLATTDSIIIPVRTDTYSITGKTAIIGRIEEARVAFDKPLPILGFLITSFEDTKIGREVKQFFKDAPNLPTFGVRIRKCVKCSEAPRLQMSLFEYAPDSTAADDYMMLAETITSRKPRPKKWVPSVWGKKAMDAFEVFANDQNT